MRQRFGKRAWVPPTPLLALGLALTLWGCTGTSGVAGGLASASRPTQALFNGRDLTGWNGDPRYWRVEGGAIVGETSAENPLLQNTFIRWEEGTLDDFHLRLQFRLTGGNSGVQYRSRVVDGWSVAGYQADIDAANNYTGMLYEEGGRGFVARRGQRVIVEPNGAINVVGSVGDPAELASHIRKGGWNTLEITARGNHLVHRVNGRITAEATDNHVEGRSNSGILALQIHTGPPMKVEFRDISLTRLSPAAPSR